MLFRSVLEVYRDHHLVTVSGKRTLRVPLGPHRHPRFQVRLRFPGGFSPMSRVGRVPRSGR